MRLYINYKKIKGFSLVEIIIAFGIATIIFVSVFEFIAIVRVKTKTNQDKSVFNFTNYKYGEKICALENDTLQSFHITKQVNLSSFISTSTVISSIHQISPSEILLTTNSSSTTEPDIYIFNISKQEDLDLSVKSSIDVGPGIEDSIMLGFYLYIANTSVNSHIKVFHIERMESNIFTELINIKISTLGQSSSISKVLHMYNNQIFLGSEKSNTGGELFPLYINKLGTVIAPTSSLEIGGQVHSPVLFKNLLLVPNSSDPELRLYNNSLRLLATYDAPLTLGNGKSVLDKYPYIIFGRTIGSGELILLLFNQVNNNFAVKHTVRTFGSVDFLQNIFHDLETVNNLFIALTSNIDKEFQIWKIEDENLKIVQSINLPGRVTAFDCYKQNMIMSVNINNIPTLVWLEK